MQAALLGNNVSASFINVSQPDLRAVVAEQRLRGREAGTLTGLSADISHLRTALDTLASKVRSHEEELRKLRRR